MRALQVILVLVSLISTMAYFSRWCTLQIVPFKTILLLMAGYFIYLCCSFTSTRRVGFSDLINLEFERFKGLDQA